VETAAEEYRKALLFLPDEPEYRLSLSIALIELGRTDEAESHLQELLEDDPTNGLINLMLARVAERRKRPLQAIDYFQRAVYGYWPREKIPVRHAARWELVALLENQHRRNEVIGELLQLYANAPNDPQEKSKIGFLLLHYGATSDAMNVFGELTRDNPKFALAFRGLGQSYFASQEYVAARREYQRAGRLDPSDKETQQQLQRVNAVLDIDPMLPGLSSTARLRKTRALLERVLSGLEACAKTNSGLSDPLKQALQDDRKLLETNKGDVDQQTDQLQGAVSQLWKNKASYCGDKAGLDQIAETVIKGMQQ
jgi:tetratricopeptide (TPR) repeat protein